MKTKLLYSVFVATAVVVAGCSKSENVTQSSPALPPSTPVTQAAPSPQPAALPPGHPDISGMSAQSLPPNSAADAPNPQWTVPSGWQTGSASSMRRATFLVSGEGAQTAEVAVSVFPGDVGGLMANINRWRGQIGLGPAAPDEISGFTSDVEVDGTKSTVVDLKGETVPPGRTQPTRMIVVTVPHGGNSWFFKITGDAPLVEKQKEAFLQFVKSVKF